MTWVRCALSSLPLLAAAAFAGRESDALRGSPRAAPGAASLLGGFAAIAVQVLWMRADQAVMDHREDDALVAFAAINELEPQLVSSGDFIARALGYNLAEDHTDPAVRWSFGREGWRVLCRTVARNPGEARAYAARGRYALLRLETDPAMRAGFLVDVDPAGPLESARRDYEEAARRSPQWREPWDGVGLASMALGLDLAARGGFDEAGPRFARARDAFARVVDLLAKDADPDIAANRLTISGNVEIADALAAACSAPPADRRARYDDVRRRFPDARIPPARPR